MRFALVAAAWLIAKSPLAPPPLAAALAAAAVLVLPGALIERLLFGSIRPYGWFAAPARWLTWSVALTALIGIGASATEGQIGEVLLALGVASLALSLVPSREPPPGDATATDAGEVAARGGLLLLTALLTFLAASAANVARDRMWYLAFLTRLAEGGVIDWAEPFLGTGNLAARFAYNGWLLSMAAWSGLGGVPTALVFERLAPPLLCIAVASAAWHFAARAVPRVPGLAALATVASLVATHYPFFSPDRYPFFTRIAEDKTVALLVFVPVTMAAVLEAARTERRIPAAAAWVTLALGVVAAGFGHGLVALLVCISLAAMTLFSAFSPEISFRRVVAAAVVTAILVAVPGRMALIARDRIVDTDDPAAAWNEDETHPVVRAHLRMGRTLELSRGGPIVDPALISDPLLLAGALGTVRALALRASAGGALIAAMTVPFFALAFMPYLAPLFARTVLPWMAYRALWMIPFGALAALLVAVELPRRVAIPLRAGFAALLVFHALAALPERREAPAVVSPGFAGNFSNGSDNERMLALIAALPNDARIAAAPGFAELVPALAGRTVLSFSDRGTVVFAGSRTAAAERLRATALIVGLAPGSPHLRRSVAASNGVTHAVLHDRHCGRFGSEVGRSGSLALCEVRPDPDQRHRSLRRPGPSGARDPDPASARATLENGWSCSPSAPVEQDAAGAKIWRWHRMARWTARPVAVRCRADFAAPVRSAALRIAADLPRAREAVVYRVTMHTASGLRTVVAGYVMLEGSNAVEIPLETADVNVVRLRLAPANLPYLNLRELTLRERDGV